MSSFVEYDHTEPLQFGGALPEACSAEDAAALILPIPFDRTTSYVSGTRYGPSALLAASSQVELWDEEIGVDVHGQGIFTLPELDLSSFTLEDAIGEIRRVASVLAETGKFVITLGGEHSITSPLVDVAASRHRGLSVLQIDAHADLRPSYLGQRHSHACAMRRTIDFAPLVQVGIRNISTDEVEVVPQLDTTIFYDWNMRDDPKWIDRAVDALSDRVYVTIDLDGLDPATMPAVGTPEPGGLSWRELTTLLRRTFERRHVVACDVVELCPIPGMASPNFIAAKLVYKLLTYKLGLKDGPKA
ncbi:MAG TPA: agmatinase [Vicinamibacterales bacterium]|jgi:agmatinase|nr:agmatinase [Vicinamibacterales bacterium]